MADNPISIDAIELNVKTSTDSAASSVDKLTGSLHRLKAEMNASGGVMPTAKQFEDIARGIQKVYGVSGKDLSLKNLQQTLRDIADGTDIGKEFGESLTVGAKVALKGLGKTILEFSRKSIGGKQDVIDIMRDAIPVLKLTSGDLAQLRYMGKTVRDVRSVFAGTGIKVSTKNGTELGNALAHTQFSSLFDNSRENIGIEHVLQKVESAKAARKNSYIQSLEMGGVSAEENVVRDIWKQIRDAINSNTVRYLNDFIKKMENSPHKPNEEEAQKAWAEIDNKAVGNLIDRAHNNDNADHSLDYRNSPWALKHKEFYERGEVIRKAGMDAEYEERLAKAKEESAEASEMEQRASEETGSAAVEAAQQSKKAIQEAKKEMLSYTEATSMGRRELLEYKRVMAGNRISDALWAGNEDQMVKGIAAYQAAQTAIDKYDAGETKKAGDAIREADAVEFLKSKYDALPASIQHFIDVERQAGTSSADLVKKLFNLDGELKQKPKDASKAASGLSTLGKAMKALRSHTHKTHHAHNNLLKQFGRVAKMRALRWVIRSLTGAFKEGIQNLYQYSKAIKGHFASAMDSGKSSLLVLRNSIATAVAPLIEALLPTMQKVVGWIREAANWLAQVFAQLNGQSSWTRAKDYVTTYADATKEAKDNTKEMLASFDELNVISSESGSGSGTKALDYKSMFEEVSTFDKSSTQWAERLRKILDKAKEVFEWLKEKVKQIYPAIRDAFAKIAPVIKDFIDQIMPIVTEVIEVVTPIISEAVTWLAQAITDAWPTIKKVLEFIKEHINIILPAVLGIKAAIGGWNIAKHLISNLTSIGTATSGILKNFNLLKAIGTIGITLAVDTTLSGVTGISAVGMAAHILKTMFTEGPAAFSRSGMDNPIAQWVSTQIGEDLTKQYLQDMGFKLSKSEAGLSVVNADGSVSLNKHAIEKLGKDAERAQELANIFADSMSTITQSGLDAQEFLNNLDLIVPMLQDKDLKSSAKSILYAVKTYGKDWIFHLEEIGADTTTILKLLSRQYLAEGKKLPQNLAKGIMSDKSFRQSLLSIAGIAKISVKEIEDIINNADLMMPIVQKYGYEKSIDIIKSIAFTAGHDTKYILENWDLLAPYIDTEFLEQSVNDILKLIDKYGAEWKEHLDELHLNVGIGLSDTVNKISGLIKQYGKDWKKHLKELNLEADVNAEKTLKAVTVLIDKYGIEEWQKHLDELDLTAEIGVKVDDGQLTDTTNFLLAKIKEARANIDREMAGAGSSSGGSSGSNYNSSSNAIASLIEPDLSVAYAGSSSGTTASTAGTQVNNAVLGTQTLTQSWAKGYYGTISTITDLLASLTAKYPNVFGQQFQIKTDKGKANSYKLEVFNLTKDEVAWLKANGYKIPSGYEHYNYGKGIRQIRQMYTGGYDIPSGDLFMANERGAELVGQIGNKTAVANQNQIIAGIATGVKGAMAGIERRLERIEQYAGITADKDFSVKITPSVGLGRVNAQSAAMYGAVTGK